MNLQDSQREVSQIAKLAYENIENLRQLVSNELVGKLTEYCNEIMRQINVEVEYTKGITCRATVNKAALCLTEQIQKIVEPILQYQQVMNSFMFKASINPVPRQPPQIEEERQIKPINQSKSTEVTNKRKKGKINPPIPQKQPFQPPPSLTNGQIPRQMCHICYQKFNNGIQLSNHLTELHMVVPKVRVPPPVRDYPIYSKLQVSDLNYTCNYCKKVFDGAFPHYRMHLNEVHARNQWFVCTECSSSYENAFDLSKHIFGAHSTRLHMYRFIYRCLATMKEFWSVKMFQQHIKETMAYHRQVPDGFEKYMIKK